MQKHRAYKYTKFRQYNPLFHHYKIFRDHLFKILSSTQKNISYICRTHPHDNDYGSYEVQRLYQLQS